MQAVRQIANARKLSSVMDPRTDVKNAIKELQLQASRNGISDMSMEEIDAEISLCRKERAERKALKKA